MEIASRVLAGIAAEAGASPGREVCGLLFGDAARVSDHRACPNVAADPAVRFEIDPAALLAAHRAARGGGPAIVGCYHSHPSGRAAPSPRDAADAAPDGWLWLIAGGGEISAWRAVGDGAIHGRFDAVDFRRVDDA